VGKCSATVRVKSSIISDELIIGIRLKSKRIFAADVGAMFLFIGALLAFLREIIAAVKTLRIGMGSTLISRS